MDKINRIVELVISEEDGFGGVFAIGAVKTPAIEEGAILLNKEANVILAKEDERGVFTGPVLIPRKQILRKDGEDYYYIWFSSDTVRKASELFLMNGYQSEFTEQHERPIDGLTTVESWIVDDPTMDKAKGLGFDVPKGTWMMSVKVDNEDVKNEIREGEITGFSIEGLFNENVNMNGIDAELEQLGKELSQMAK